MHTLISETDPETIVQFIEYGQFIPDECKQILTIGSKLLRIFRLNGYGMQKSNGDYEPQLECICQYQFISPIIAVTKIRLPGGLITKRYILFIYSIFQDLTSIALLHALMMLE